MILFAHRHSSYSSYSFLRHFWNLINKIRRIFCQVQIYQQYVTCIRIKKKDDLAVNINFDSVITKVRLKREWKSEGKKKKGREKRKVYPRKITFSSRNCGWMQISAMGTIINGEQRKEVAGRKRGRRKKKSFNKETDRPTRPSRWRDSNRCRVSEIPEIGQLSKPSSPTPISFKLERSFRERGVYFTLSNFNDRGCGYSNGRKIERERTNGRWSLVGHRDGIGNRRQRPSLNEKLNVAAY